MQFLVANINVEGVHGFKKKKLEGMLIKMF